MTKKIAIIGSGITGTLLAHHLRQQTNITVFEKARGVGGRMSTHYHNSYQFDHGAQYISATNPLFQQFLNTMKKDGIIDNWQPKIVTREQTKTIANGLETTSKQYYVPVPKMNSLCKYLATGVDLQLQKKIEKIEKQQEKWQLLSNNEVIGNEFDWVIATMPPAQTSALFPKSFAQYELVSKQNMLPCFSLMLGFNNHTTMPWDVVTIQDHAINWIANNASKPGRAKQTALVVQCQPQWSQDNLNRDAQWVTDYLLENIVDILGNTFYSPEYIRLHRWRYAYSDTQRSGKTYYLDPINQLAACGDWCLGADVESAYTSANALINALTKII